MIESLAYVGFTSPNAQEWASFGPEVLGAQQVEAADGSVVLRLDEAAWRIAIHPGDADDLAYIGWDVGDAAGLVAASSAVSGAGCEVTEGDVELAEARQVAAIATFTDPFGFRHELTHGLKAASSGWTPGRDMDGGFVTGSEGLGHLVLLVPDLAKATEFFVGRLGFGHTDDVEDGFTVRFLHCNTRHHTLAMAEIPGMAGVHHLMLEVENADDVGRAYDIVNERQMQLAMTLGRHTNDEMFSFYVRTPSGFEIEYGSGARVLDVSTSVETAQFTSQSNWGHKGPAEPLFPGIMRPVEPS